jgi:uncharacterized membrane-anchored protein
MHRIFKLAAALAAFALAAPAAAQPADAKQTAATQLAEQKARAAQIKAIQDSLHPQTGDIRIADANVVLHLGEDYYFLPAAEAKRVLTEGWGNPPDSVSDVLGLVFPKGSSFADDIWGAVVSFEASGYVSDEDAKSADYSELLESMQSSESELNAKRTAAGYPAQHLVGWAQPPVYDPRSHSVVWAQDIQFQGQSENSLNYDIRMLGRRGVLSLNMVTTMDKLGETRTAASRFARAAEFDQGARYADYMLGDAKAEYGVAGLVAAGVGVVAAKKLGLLGVILVFGKKFIVLILAGMAVLGGFFRRLFGGGGDEADEGQLQYADGPADYAPPPAADGGSGLSGDPDGPAPPDRSWVG